MSGTAFSHRLFIGVLLDQRWPGSGITKDAGEQTMRSVVLLGMLLSAIPSAADAAVLVCRGSISQEWGYLSINTADGIECIITRRVGMQTVLNICGSKRCMVTGVGSDQEGAYQYLNGLIAVEIDTLQWGQPEPKPLGDPTLSE
jgi:hypothetical protein